MIVRIHVSVELVIAALMKHIYLAQKSKINSYADYKFIIEDYVKYYGNSHVTNDMLEYFDQETYNKALAIVNKYYHKTKGGKNMSNSEVSEDPKPVVNGGEETTDQQEVKPTADQITTEDTSETKPVND